MFSVSPLSIHLIFKQLCGLLLTNITSKIGQCLGFKLKKRASRQARSGLALATHSEILKKLTVIEENKWSKQCPDYHTFIIDGGLLVPKDTGEGKFISIQIRSRVLIKFLLLDVFALFFFNFQASLLHCWTVQKK